VAQTWPSAVARLVESAAYQKKKWVLYPLSAEKCMAWHIKRKVIHFYVHKRLILFEYKKVNQKTGLCTERGKTGA